LTSYVSGSEYLELLDWRRRMAELFVDLRRRPPDADTLAWFRAHKDALFKDHPQSPIPAPDRAHFAGLAYWPFDPAARVEARFTPLDQTPAHASRGDSDGDGDSAAREARSAQHAEGVPFRRIGHLEFELNHHTLRLGAFWIEGYAGGLFVPFTDATSGHQTYGGGRYVLDTIKSADLGSDAAAGLVSLDFNYAYHPSCTYDPRWVCPLAPPDSRLAIPIPAGERLR
jgi:uncharacterized protein